jgi:hypothetical protein
VERHLKRVDAAASYSEQAIAGVDQVASVLCPMLSRDRSIMDASLYVDIRAITPGTQRKVKARLGHDGMALPARGEVVWTRYESSACIPLIRRENPVLSRHKVESPPRRKGMPADRGKHLTTGIHAIGSCRV